MAFLRIKFAVQKLSRRVSKENNNVQKQDEVDKGNLRPDQTFQMVKN